MLDFEWDDAKAAANLAKHGIGFPTACRVFDDGFAVDFEDRTMDYGEMRRIAIGMVQGEVLAVVYSERETVIRIISARKATRQERHEYAKAREGN
jgi:uncharacterized DUF497 family protein